MGLSQCFQCKLVRRSKRTALYTSLPPQQNSVSRLWPCSLSCTAAPSQTSRGGTGSCISCSTCAGLWGRHRGLWSALGQLVRPQPCSWCSKKHNDKHTLHSPVRTIFLWCLTSKLRSGIQTGVWIFRSIDPCTLIRAMSIQLGLSCLSLCTSILSTA